MNKFSDLLATNESLVIGLNLHPTGSPHIRVSVNGQNLYLSQLDEQLNLELAISLRDSISIEVELREKIYTQAQETALVIDQVSIDDFLIVPAWTHLAQYQNDHDITGPTSYLGFNGVWSLTIPEPFYQWRHKILNLGWLLDPVNLA